MRENRMEVSWWVTVWKKKKSRIPSNPNYHHGENHNICCFRLKVTGRMFSGIPVCSCRISRMYGLRLSDVQSNTWKYIMAIIGQDFKLINLKKHCSSNPICWYLTTSVSSDAIMKRILSSVCWSLFKRMFSVPGGNSNARIKGSAGVALDVKMFFFGATTKEWCW